jgi:hypothetical protein
MLPELSSLLPSLKVVSIVNCRFIDSSGNLVRSKNIVVDMPNSAVDFFSMTGGEALVPVRMVEIIPFI